ncbi:MAG: threonylcarbamoyl-AMP synthase [Deltaproteobacteria bacterium HGW-Deltaproteobacteria-6]|jgi:L-threonylcarbamoyladenylate synthase|nr:MAG: threonylcarbamoyl-AMP synthase [Deltaproteobacteria bacterium HGW-Deltaproteobacteria-6]
MPEILKIDGDNSEEAVLSRAVEILTAGGVIAYPTETFYGLGVDAANEKAIRKIYDIKGRNFTNPISVIIDCEKNLFPLVEEVPARALKLMQSFWPGPLTIVFKAAAETSPLLTAQTGKIGVRVSSNACAMNMARNLGHPLTATSANLSGAPECSTAFEVIGQIGNKIDAVVDWGKTAGGKGSTIIDVTSDPPQILREGVISRPCLATYGNFL